MRASHWAGWALAVVLPAVLAAPPRYTLEAVPAPDGWNTDASALGGDFLAATAKSSDGAHQVALVVDRHQVRDCKAFHKRVTVANSINAEGTVAGVAGDRAFYAPLKGRAQHLFPNGFDGQSAADSINARGEMAGYYITRSSGQHQAFIWRRGGFDTIPPLHKGQPNWARAINDLGVAVGVSYDARGGSHAFVHDGTTRELPGLGQWGADAWAINASGWVVGTSRVDSNLNGRPVLWRDGQVTDLGAANDIRGIARGINAQGAVVGTQYGLVYGDTRGWVWMDGQLVELNQLVDGLSAPWKVTAAKAIDDRGRIAVTLGHWSKVDHRFRRVAAVLTPVVERDQ